MDRAAAVFFTWINGGSEWGVAGSSGGTAGFSARTKMSVSADTLLWAKKGVVSGARFNSDKMALATNVCTRERRMGGGVRAAPSH